MIKKIAYSALRVAKIEWALVITRRELQSSLCNKSSYPFSRQNLIPSSLGTNSDRRSFSTIRLFGDWPAALRNLAEFSSAIFWKLSRGHFPSIQTSMSRVSSPESWQACSSNEGLPLAIWCSTKPLRYASDLEDVGSLKIRNAAFSILSSIINYPSWCLILSSLSWLPWVALFQILLLPFWSCRNGAHFGLPWWTIDLSSNLCMQPRSWEVIATITEAKILWIKLCRTNHKIE